MSDKWPDGWSPPNDPEMSMREYWDWARENDQEWRRGMSTALVIALTGAGFLILALLISR